MKRFTHRPGFSYSWSTKYGTRFVTSVGKNVKRWQQTYEPSTIDAAESVLEALSAKWDEKYPTITPSWNNRERLIVIFDFAPEIRKAIYTTNAIELNASLRKFTKTHKVLPIDESVFKLLYLALHNISAKWTMPIKDWKPAMSQFMLMYGDRIIL